ncbi:zinc ribbon domain-containing protein [Streptomyces sp. A1499]|uniref:NADase-type glycan-binding domain-containing protein n=1 Tax=Streptomyces sp. A1499 TaxID=2563104 RepID=UPI00109E6FBA|nr:zinc ribbon domain-containing protein [Streptomyces sp. A1499]THC43423.1 zinc ribbon domain-containing protein [Streptomyces sp. A1499]
MTSQAPRSTEGARTCGECGSTADPDEPFCEACGAVLSWGGAARPVPSSTAQDPPATAATVPPAGDGAGTAPEAGRGRPAETPAGPTAPPAPAAGTPSAAPDGARPDAPADEPTAGEAPADASGTPDPSNRDRTAAVPAPAPAPSPDAIASATTRARNLIVPVPDRRPRQAPPEVTPVLPGRPEAQPLRVRAPGRPDAVPDGVPCPWCATGNAPDRHFCDRCAMPMSGAAGDAAAPVWWRRLLDRRERPAPWAGDRPRLRFGLDRVGTWLSAALVLALVACAVLYTGPAVEAVRDHFAKRAPVAPDDVRASRSYAKHGAPLAFDRLNNTWWGPGVSQAGDGDWLEARFGRPTRLLDLIITPGVSTRGDELDKSAQPHHVDAVITTAKGKKVTRRLTLDQGAGAQRRRFTVGEVTSVRLVVRSAHHASADKQLAIAEVEFFGPSSANNG